MRVLLYLSQFSSHRFFWRKGEINRFISLRRNLYNKSGQVKWRIYMGRVYKNYTKELKEQACKLVVEKNMPVRIVAEKLSV